MTTTNTVRIGQLPGQIKEYAFEAGTPLGSALETAGVELQGYEIKVDGNVTTDLNRTVDGASLILLTKMVKGNAEPRVIKVGQLPGQIKEYAFTPPTTFAEVFAEAGLDTAGYEVKADGRTITDFNSEIGQTNLILLSKMVKGN